jgi:hypothetical protein
MLTALAEKPPPPQRAIAARVPRKLSRRQGVASNPQGYNPKTAMTFRGLRSRKDIDDVIAYIKGGN